MFDNGYFSVNSGYFVVKLWHNGRRDFQRQSSFCVSKSWCQGTGRGQMWVRRLLTLPRNFSWGILKSLDIDLSQKANADKASDDAGFFDVAPEKFLSRTSSHGGISPPNTQAGTAQKVCLYLWLPHSRCKRWRGCRQDFLRAITSRQGNQLVIRAVRRADK